MSTMAQTGQELQGFQSLTRVEMEQAARLGVQLGEQNARMFLAAALSGNPDARIAAVFHKLPTEAITQLLGFLDQGGPLVARINELAPYTTKLVSDKLVEAVARGYNPRKTAAIIQNAYGNGLTDALRMTRTVQLYSYRESSRASYAANGDVLSGWQWYAQLDGLTCMSCVANHGKIFPMSEPLNDHYNGRCAMLPVTNQFGAYVPENAGEEWFNGLSEAEQRNQMGKGKHEAWKDGKFGFEQLVSERDDAVYGPMKTAATLKEVVK